MPIHLVQPHPSDPSDSGVEEAASARKRARESIVWILLPFAVTLLFGVWLRFASVPSATEDIVQIHQAAEKLKGSGKTPQEIIDDIVKTAYDRKDDTYQPENYRSLVQ